MGKKYILELIPWSLFFSLFFLILPSLLPTIFSLGKKPNIWEDITMHLLGSSISIFVSSAIKISSNICHEIILYNNCVQYDFTVFL